MLVLPERTRFITPISPLAANKTTRTARTITRPRLERVGIGACTGEKAGTPGSYVARGTSVLASAVFRASNRCVVLRTTFLSSTAVFISDGSACDATGTPHARQKFVP